MTIAILGGTGPQGQGLAKRFALAGVAVAIGSRDAQRAAQIADELNASLAGHENASAIQGMSNEEAVALAERIVLLAVPYAAHDATLQAVADGLRDAEPSALGANRQ